MSEATEEARAFSQTVLRSYLDTINSLQLLLGELHVTQERTDANIALQVVKSQADAYLHRPGQDPDAGLEHLVRQWGVLAEQIRAAWAAHGVEGRLKDDEFNMGLRAAIKGLEAACR